MARRRHIEAIPVVMTDPGIDWVSDPDCDDDETIPARFNECTETIYEEDEED